MADNIFAGSSPSQAADPFAGPPPSKRKTMRATPESNGARPQNTVLFQEPGIDYNTGASIDMITGLSRASNPKEAELFMKNNFGAGRYGQDKYGNWWGEQDGKRIAINPSNTSFAGVGKNVASTLASGAPVTAGAIGGAVLGEMAFPLGGGIPGAMLGAAAGKGYDELLKWYQGFFDKTPAETVGEIGNEGAIAGAFQGAGPIAGKAARGIKSGIQRWFGTTAASRAMGRELSAGGARPPVGSLAPEATATEYKRGLRNTLAGDPQEAGRLAYVDTRMRKIFEHADVPDSEVGTLMKEVYDRSSRVSADAAGRAVTAKAGEIQRLLLQDADMARQHAGRILRGIDDSLRKMAQAPASLSEDVATAIKGERRTFSREMTRIYSAVDRLTGDRAIVPTGGIQAAAKDTVHIMPPQAVPPIIKQWADKPPQQFITFEQAHALRTMLREVGELIDVSPTGQRIGNVRKLSAAVDSAINSMTDKIGIQAAKALKAADTAYAKGIAKFNDASVNKLVKDIRSGMPPEPGYVAKQIMNPDRVNMAKAVFNMLPPQVRDGVVKADLETLIANASVRRPDGTMTMDGATLRDLLDSRKMLMNATYPQAAEGASLLKGLRTYGDALAAYNGKIDVTQIRNPSDITNLLQRGVAASRAADEFARHNPLGALASGDAKVIDRAAEYLATPGNEAITAQVAKTLGANSDQWKSVQRYALQKMFAESVIEKPSLGRTLSGSSIENRLKKFTEKQQELLFPNGLATDMQLLSKEIRFLFPENPQDMGQSLAAASIKSGLPFNLWSDYKYARAIMSGWIADHPKMIRLLANEVKLDKPHARSTMSVLSQWVINGVRNGPGSGSPNTAIKGRIPNLPPEEPPAGVIKTKYKGLVE